MVNVCIDERNQGYYISGTRISLDSVVYSFRRGNAAEAILEEYPTLNLSQIREAINYYTEHREAIDCYLEAKRKQISSSSMPLSEANPELSRRISQAREATKTFEMGEPRRARFLSVGRLAA